MKINFNFKKTKISINEFFEKHKEWILNAKNFIILVFGYGLLINAMLWSVFNFSFTYYSFIGYGIFFYLIKEEFPEWFRKLFPDRRVR